jgi:hypothetical protein
MEVRRSARSGAFAEAFAECFGTLGSGEQTVDERAQVQACAPDDDGQFLAGANFR